MAAQGEEPPPDKGKKEKAAPAKVMEMQIDVLKLNIGKVVYKDYSRGDKPVVQAYDVQIKDKTYENITSGGQLAAIVMTSAMGPTAIKGAKIYAATALLGVGFLPAGVAGVLIGKDSGSAEFDVGFNTAFDVAVQVVTDMGRMKSSDKGKGVVKAKVDGSDVVVKVVEQDKDRVAVTVSARKLMVPKAQVAEGVLYQISEKLE